MWVCPANRCLSAGPAISRLAGGGGCGHHSESTRVKSGTENGSRAKCVWRPRAPLTAMCGRLRLRSAAPDLRGGGAAPREDCLEGDGERACLAGRGACAPSFLRVLSCVCFLCGDPTLVSLLSSRRARSHASIPGTGVPRTAHGAPPQPPLCAAIRSRVCRPQNKQREVDKLSSSMATADDRLKLALKEKSAMARCVAATVPTHTTSKAKGSTALQHQTIAGIGKQTGKACLTVARLYLCVCVCRRCGSDLAAKKKAAHETSNALRGLQKIKNEVRPAQFCKIKVGRDERLSPRACALF